MYILIDNTNHFLRGFETYHEADCFRISKGRLDWLIIEYFPADYKSTPKQRQAIGFCEHMLGVLFTGNINSGRDCSAFLSDYLIQAKQLYTELKCDYETDY